MDKKYFVCINCGKSQFLDIYDAEKLGWYYGIEAEYKQAYFFRPDIKTRDLSPLDPVCFDCWQPNKMNAHRLVKEKNIRIIERKQ